MKRFEKVFEPKVALPLITLIATVFRVIPLRYKYLFGYDPYFHLAYIEESLKAGKWINFLTIAGGPWGTKISHPLGLYLAPYYVYKILKIFGVSLYDAFRITPVIFGVLTIIFFYLAMLNFYGKKEAFFSAFFLSIMFGHVFRSMANYYRGDNYMLFWYSVALFGISLAIKYASMEEWKYRRFAFYLIPAFASGLAAIFWQGYYPIFVFLLANAFFMAIGTFLLDKKEHFMDSIVLVISTVVGALLAIRLGEKYGYGIMTTSFEWIAKKFGINLGNIRDVYLWSHLMILVPLALVFILILCVLGKIRNPRIKYISLIGSTFIITVIIFLMLNKYLEFWKGILTWIFGSAPILEIQKTSFKDLFAAYNILPFLIPFYFLRFKNPKISDFLHLGLIFPSLLIVYYRTRFLFIGSMAIALMSGVGLVNLHRLLSTKLDERKTLALSVSLLVVIPVISAGLGFEKVYAEKPLINDHWIQALTWLKDNSNENDVVLSWWDYGHWVTYYARRSPIAQGGSSKWVALYYLGKVNNNQLMARGVDYAIVSYDTALKFGAILDTANVSKEGYFLAILPLVSKVGALIFQQGQYTITARPGKEWSILINTGTAVFSPKEAFLEYKNSIIKLNITTKNVADAYVYLNLNYGYAVLMSEKTFNTTLAKLMFTNEYSKDYQLVYSDGGYIKIFKFRHPNVAVEQTENEIIFKFENATGTGLGVFGYLENGTQVFKKWYSVKGKTEFILLKDQVNGTVIRYAYAEGKKIVDRGVFRKE
ncbi:MAG: oligosaccharyl transferase, STT3 subunit [Thermococcus sp.]|uniref:STT3 domain-containing protein n=1 Tax=Thermococcus sp. TaxID=35749 RepID=UPI001DF0EA97|nr:STT3 domain-containing protein [Thermococcus sp.]MBO8175050.1 oligosaccharyl transferase, STT3 subunit [Thermococcus sp.]